MELSFWCLAWLQLFFVVENAASLGKPSSSLRMSALQCLSGLWMQEEGAVRGDLKWLLLLLLLLF
jgi:hypothetical protein